MNNSMFTNSINMDEIDPSLKSPPSKLTQKDNYYLNAVFHLLKRLSCKVFPNIKNPKAQNQMFCLGNGMEESSSRDPTEEHQEAAMGNITLYAAGKMWHSLLCGLILLSITQELSISPVLSIGTFGVPNLSSVIAFLRNPPKGK